MSTECCVPTANNADYECCHEWHIGKKMEGKKPRPIPYFYHLMYLFPFWKHKRQKEGAFQRHLLPIADSSPGFCFPGTLMLSVECRPCVLKGRVSCRTQQGATQAEAPHSQNHLDVPLRWYFLSLLLNQKAIMQRLWLSGGAFFF